LIDLSEPTRTRKTDRLRSGTACGLCILAMALLGAARERPADLLLVHGQVYTFAWNEPATDGRPAAGAPHDAKGWHPDATAVGIRGGRIVFVGSDEGAQAFRGPRTRVRDLGGATVLPGLIDAHVHIANLGAKLEQVDLVGVATEEEAVRRVAERAARTPKGEWIVGWGWDEGAWANRYPDMKLLSERVPDHPVLLRGLHSFAVWGNRLAFERAKITTATPAPSGGEIGKDPQGQPTGILLNTATGLLEGAVPPLTPEALEERVLRGLTEMARNGYVAVEDASAGPELIAACERLAKARRLPIRLWIMVDARNPTLAREWIRRGPETDPSDKLVIRTAKAFYDGALGSRGAKLLADYSDRPGHRGVGGAENGFDATILRGLLGAGFQVAVHAIGDAGNRETLDFFADSFAKQPKARQLRNRIEHAQVLHPDDVPRFASLGVIASMQPPHAVEDKAWAEERLGPERVRNAYAWRTLRKSGARLVFSSDLPGSDYDPFYGLHSAITRRGRDLQPPGGWYPEQTMTAEEALRGYTVWAAYSLFQEKETGVLARGRWADLTVMDVDPLTTADSDPAGILKGHVLLTVVDGKVAFEGGSKL
jgi:predicted amidohydrolase YtcJ